MDKKLPTIYHSVYEQDTIPDPSIVGSRVYWVVDNEARYGVIAEVNHKNVVVKLEKRWNHRVKVILNWRMVRMAASQEQNLPPQKGKIDPVRIEALKVAVLAATRRSPEHLTHYNDIDARQLIETAHATSETLKEYINSIEVMRITIQNLAQELEDQIDKALTYGIDPNRLPSRPEIDGRSRRKKNDDIKRKLSHVREHTRDLLVSLLLAADEDGATSEEVVATLCSLPHPSELPITQHRVMGMLSAFSRRGEAQLIPPNKWKATNKLILSQGSDAGA